MSTTLFSLAGRTALVTGSSRGLGRAMAEGLARAGAKVIINGMNATRVDEAVAAMRLQGLVADGAVFDVTDEAAVTSAFATLDAAGAVEAGAGSDR